MDHNIIHHTETVIPLREPLTREAAIKAIDAVVEEFELEDWQKVTLLAILTHSGNSSVTLYRQKAGKNRILQALDRIEEARAHGLA